MIKSSKEKLLYKLKFPRVAEIKERNSNYLFVFFYLALFLLPSAFIISALLLIIVVGISAYKSPRKYLNDTWNIPLLLAGIIMIISAIIHTTNSELISKYNLDISLTWIGLANWIPFFWFFWGFQPFLNSERKRKIAGMILLSGTMPVIVSGLGQSIFGWYGPHKLLNGLIIWYQRPIEGITGLTGLFNNPNYAGIWLNIIWPFCLASLLNLKKDSYEKIFIYFFTSSITLTTILTNSRSAWLGILIGSLIMLEEKHFSLIRNLILILSTILGLTIFPLLGGYIQNSLRNFIPESIWMEFTDFQYGRLEIWLSGIKTIFNNPIYGTGAGSFSQIFRYESGLWKGHAHNLPLELAISYGIPALILISIPISLILYKLVRNISFIKNKFELDKSNYDKAWIISFLILLISQMVDVQYFDGRISLIGWLLLAGMKCLVEEINNKKIIKQ